MKFFIAKRPMTFRQLTTATEGSDDTVPIIGWTGV